MLWVFYEELVEKLFKEIDTLNYNKKGKNLNERELQSVLIEEILTEKVGRDKKSDKRDRSKSISKEMTNPIKRVKNLKERC